MHRCSCRFLIVARPFIAATACNSRKAHPLLGLGVVFHIVERGDRSQKRTDRKGTSKRGWKDGRRKAYLHRQILVSAMTPFFPWL